MGSKMDYHVAIDEEQTANMNYMEKYGARGIPHAFIIDKKGKVVWNGHPMVVELIDLIPRIKALKVQLKQV